MSDAPVEIPTPRPLADILQLTPEEEISKARVNVVSGSVDYIRTRFNHTYLPLEVGWWKVEKSLQAGGATVFPRFSQAYVNTEMWPGIHAKIIAEHEVMETVLGKSEGKSTQILQELELFESIRSAVSNPRYKIRYDHYAAIIYELRLAHDNGVLEEHIKLRADIHKRARPDDERANEFDIRYMNQVKALLEK